MSDKKVGKVWLVGAGPSDPGLFTLKGKQVLDEAEVVVYDALAGQSVLNMIPDTVERIHVGKRSSHHTIPQKEINELLAEKAKEGKRVVRLKGGDPFLFGRGGEEVERLVQDGIPYEIVPGITSAISVPAYQGIPVTHRDFCSSVHIITGHKRAGFDYDIDFEALVRTKGTLVFLMGVTALGDICRGLLAAGIDPGMPAALLSQGTTAAQRRIVATVSTLEEEVKKKGPVTPAIIVIGRVCTLADQFSWYDKLPLGGVKVLLTRPKELISETAKKLRSFGAEVLEIPAIATVRIRDNALLSQGVRGLEQYQWIVFTSPAGVRIFFEELAAQRADVRKLGNAKIAAIGGGTAKELAKHGLFADLVPETYDAAHLGAALADACRDGEKILIPRAAIGSRELTEALAKSGKKLQVDDIATYDTVYETEGLISVRDELEKGTIDYVVFTSASTVRGFAKAADGADLTRVKAVCIGRQTLEAADALGMQTWMAQKASIDSLIDRLIEVHQEHTTGTV